MPRDVTNYKAETATGVNAVEPWFSGKARVTCNQAVEIRTGGEVTRYELATKDRLVQIAVIVIAVLPFLLVAIFRFGVRRKKAAATES
jgi:hypothetical protein